LGTKQAEAELILKLYEMRRDEKLRQAREWFDTQFDPQSAQDIIDVVSGSFSESANFRMVLTYWEMVAALVNYGSIDANLIHTSNVEHLRYYAKIEPFMAEVRKLTGPTFLAELEKMAKTAPDYEKRLAGWRELNKGWAEKYKRSRKVEDGEPLF
jgi:hypothetical protein